MKLIDLYDKIFDINCFYDFGSSKDQFITKEGMRLRIENEISFCTRPLFLKKIPFKIF